MNEFDRKIRINYTYYNNPELLQEVIEFYEPYKDSFNFSIIDDGSQEHPLTKQMLPDYWAGYRIEEDLGWGNEVARNILMRHTPNVWNALLDLDIVIDLTDPRSLQFFAAPDTHIPEFVEYFNNLRDAKLTYQFPVGGRTDYHDYTKEITGNAGNFAINSFIVSHHSWNKSYGYDMAFAYTYGMDCTISGNMTEVGMPYGRLKKLCNQAVPDPDRILNKEVYNEFFARAKACTLEYNYNPFTFLWPNEEVRLKNVIEYPKVVALK